MLRFKSRRQLESFWSKSEGISQNLDLRKIYNKDWIYIIGRKYGTRNFYLVIENLKVSPRNLVAKMVETTLIA